ncbi:MAG: hypothetical protein LBF68_05425 [Christensenellaceae bacterium]|jgi:hypothetical protein|nr:hypothetical protein [Christensenellaceae bacterium]
MIKRFFTLHIYSIVLLIIILTAFAFIGASVYAAINSTIDFNDIYLAGTDVFYFDSNESSYSKDYSVTTASTSVSVTIKRNDKTNDHVYTKLDLLVFSDGIEATYTATGVTSKHTNVSLSSKTYKNCSIIENITFKTTAYSIAISTPPTNQTINVVVIPRAEYYYETPNANGTYQGHTAVTPNRYVVDLFDLEMLNTEERYNFYLDPNVPMHRQQYYKNVYFLSDIIVNRELIINYPGFLNLLFAKIQLYKPLTIMHTSEGMYDIKTLGGKIYNSTEKFTINTPKAYYSESGSTDTSHTSFICTSTTNFSKTTNVDFTDPLNSALLNAALSDAVVFAQNHIPFQLLKDLILPNEYQSLGITYTYILKDTSLTNLATIGHLDRDLWNASSTTQYKLEIIANYGGTSLSKTIDIELVGTGIESITSALANAYYNLGVTTGILLPEIDIQTATVKKDQNNSTIFISSLKQDLEMTDLLETFIYESNLRSDISLVLTPASPIDFLFNDELYRRVDLTYSTTYQKYRISFSKDPSTPDNVTFYSLDSIQFFASPQTLLLLASEAEMKVITYNLDLDNNLNNNIEATSAVAKFYVYGISFKEQQMYLERFIENKYVTSKDQIVNLLRVDTALDRIFNGPTEEVIPYTFNLKSITYNFYCVDSDDADYLVDLNNTYDAKATYFATIINNNSHTINPSAPPGDDTYNSFFIFDTTNSTMELANDVYLNIPDGTSMIIKIDLTYEQNVVLPHGVGDYSTYRRFIIPKEGLGGNDSTKYLLGDTFAEYFNNLVNGMLIDSTLSLFTDGVETTPGTAFMLKPDSSDDIIGLRMSIVNDSEVGAYCKILQPDSVNHPYWWQIEIDIDKIPAYNSVVNVSAEFFIIVNNAETPLSEQLYSFIIPGIYRVGASAEFKSTQLYELIISIKDNSNNYLYGYYESQQGDKYLLVDYAQKDVDTLEITQAALDSQPSGAVPASGLDLSGMEYLINTKKLIFKNVRKIISFEPFNRIDTSIITELTLDNCSLTDALLNPAYLANLQTLTYVNLNNNPNITRLSLPSGTKSDPVYTPYFYRSVEIFSLDKTGIREILDITKYPYITDLYVRDTPIPFYEPLVSLKYLKRLYLDWTQTTRNDSFYFNENLPSTSYDASVNNYLYANGVVNIPEYVTLIIKGVSIYYKPSAGVSDALMAIGENEFIPYDLYEAAIILNSIYVFRQHYNYLAFPAKVFSKNYQIGGTSNGTRTEIYVRYAINNTQTSGASYLFTAREFNHHSSPTTTSDPHATTDTTTTDDAIKFSTTPASNRLIYIVAKCTVNSTTSYKAYPLIWMGLK